MTPEQTMILLGKSAQNFGIASWLNSIQVAIPRLTHLKIADVHGRNLNTTYVVFCFDETFRYYIAILGGDRDRCSADDQFIRLSGVLL